MKRIEGAQKSNRACWVQRELTIVALLLSFHSVRPAQAAPSVRLWDTLSPVTPPVNLVERSAWKTVPAEITHLEKDPAKASSDPGYYGREYAFLGDAVMETPNLTVVFCGREGTVALYSHPMLNKGGADAQSSSPKLLATFCPFAAGTKKTEVSHYEILRNAGDDILLEVTFTNAETPGVQGTFSIGRAGILAIKPGQGMNRLWLFSPIEYGVAPSFIGDDLIVGAAEGEEVKNLAVPADNFFVGLLKGEEQLLVLTWPQGNQRLQLDLGSGQEGKRPIQAVDFQNDGHTLYVAGLQAPGVWHKEALSTAYLEKEVPSQWQRPFPAAWKTQLSEAGVKASFKFREAKGQVWRGVPGSYSYPVWFDADRAMYHLSKKIPPEGESLVYFLEGEETPASIATPADILSATLGLDTAESILDPAGRKLRTHHRRAGEGVHRACTCGCTEAIQAVFEGGQEVEQKDYVDGALHDMIYFVQRHVARIEEYQRFASDLVRFLRAQETAAPELKGYVQSLAEMAEQIPQEYKVQKENMKSLAYADELAKKTLLLTDKKDPHNLQAYMDLLKDWRAMGGAQDYVLAECHMLTRKLFQEAGAASLTNPQAVSLAQQIRARCRAVLRNPDGYEIWENY